MVRHKASSCEGDDRLRIESLSRTMLAGARSRLVNICFYSLYASGVLVLPLFIIRINAIGWNLASYVHFTIIPIGTVLVFFYKRLPLTLRGLLLIFFALISALGGLTTYGIVGSAFYGMAMMACVIAAIAFGRTTGLVTLAFSVVMFLIVMFAVMGGHHVLASNLHDYAFMPSGWVTSLVGHVLYAMMLIMGIQGMHTLLEELIAGKIKNAREIDRQKSFLESVYESTMAFLIIVDAELHIVRCNRAFMEACRYSEDGLLGASFPERLFAVEQRAAVLEYFAGRDGKGSREDGWLTGDEHAIQVGWNASPIRDAVGGTTHWIISGMDMTERRQLEKRYQHAQKLQSIGQLAGGVAHDFNNMLTAILGSAELIAAEPVSDGVKEYLGTIVRTSRKAAALTRNLLGFSRVESGPTETIDLNTAIRDAVHLLGIGMAGDVEIRQQLSPEPILVSGESSEVMNAILNLGINARDAMPDGGMISIASGIKMLDEGFVSGMPFEIGPGMFAEVSVADTGSGIPSTDLERVFDPFFTTKPRGKGTGLGLASVYGTIKRHRGAVKIYSESGQGTVVRLFFPLLTGDSAIRIAPSLTSGARPLSILLVEDEDAVRLTTAQLLEHCGHRVTMAENGREALAAMQAAPGRFDLMMLDWIMPVQGGRETLETVLRIEPSVPVIISSGFAPENSRIGEALDDRHVFFLGKPYQREELLRLVAEVFAD